MKKYMIKMAVILTALLLVPNILQPIPSIHQVAQAATKKPNISIKQITTGIGAASKKIEVKNKLKGAKYTYNSNNKKVVTVDKNGKITGISKGTGVVTVKQTYKKKVTTIGTCKIYIEMSSLDSSLEKIECGINGEITLDKWIKLVYQNESATYSYETDNEAVAVIQRECLKGISMGNTLVHVYETYQGSKRELGTVPVIIKDIPMTDLDVDPYYIIDGKFSRILYFDDITENKELDIKTLIVKTPSNATDYISYLSSDKDVATVDKNGIITAVGKGETTITAIASGKKIELHIISISCLEEDGY